MTSNRKAAEKYAKKMVTKGFIRMTIWVPESDRQHALDYARDRRKSHVPQRRPKV